ncbi:hypothetical protein JVU11DRAFT_9921 [Chiua virens]|nr:hypothetical protein JVU11DRAFT_9921 [Chiua virens]
MAQPQLQQGMPTQPGTAGPAPATTTDDACTSARSLDLVVGGPGHAFAFCNKHKVEKCDECKLDFTASIVYQKFSSPIPTSAVHPLQPVIQQKLSQAVTNTKDEGNNFYKLSKYKEALPKYNLAASIAVQRPPWEGSGVVREELSTIVSNRSATLLELGDYLGALADAETVISIRRNWPKGHFRKAKALVALGQLEEAIDSVSLGLQFEPNNAELNGYMAELQKLAETRSSITSTSEATTPDVAQPE